MQKNLASLLRAEGMGWKVGFVQDADPALEVAMKFRGCAIGESAVEDLPANERLMVGKSVAPDEARDFPRSLTDRGEIEELGGEALPS